MTDGPHNRRLKYLVLTLGDSPSDGDFQCQVSTWAIANNTPDGDKKFSYCYTPTSPSDPTPLDPDAGEFREEADADYSLTATFFADWRSEGINRWIVAHNGETVGFQILHHPDLVDESVEISGRLKVKNPTTVGGDVRTTEMSPIAWPIIGEPAYAYPGDS